MGPGAHALVQHSTPTLFRGDVQLKGVAEPTPVYGLVDDLSPLDADPLIDTN